ncbi:hypothetical protein [Spiroplasma citri]|uniref:hypothetical protein n=1 Tax=Spiroplasma citri TaxID=2133 RepID=UPI00090BBC15|nr:hypothetical protein [Spiroplasma citri]APE74045.1 hypothetical protein SCITRI_00131 [Spiroplasma citri]QIA66321.1 hypothetical protein GMI18_00615 [Spiroplasma citri]
MRKSCPKCRSKIEGDNKHLWCTNVYFIFAKNPYIFKKKKYINMFVCDSYFILFFI